MFLNIFLFNSFRNVSPLNRKHEMFLNINSPSFSKDLVLLNRKHEMFLNFKSIVMLEFKVS